MTTKKKTENEKEPAAVNDGDGDDSVDSRPSAPLQDSRPNAGRAAAADEDGSEHVEGRRNEDLPLENLSVPPTNS